MAISEKKLAANRRNIELGREKSHETWHRIKAYNQRLVECTAVCEHCHKSFNKMIRQIDLDKNRLPKHCSRSCANSRVRTDEIKAKVSEKLLRVKFVDGRRISLAPRLCKGCGKCIDRIDSKTKRYCSEECKRAHLYHMVNDEFRGTYRQYRQACSFKFNLASYPEEFDFELIKKYGFYSPKNKKDNPNGVTRDHMYSVREGLENNVPPWILAHPANCQLMLYVDNVSKNARCSITLDELNERIRIWEEKYGKYVPFTRQEIKEIDNHAPLA